MQFEPANPNFFGQRLPSGDFDLAEYAWSGGPDPSGFDAIYQTGGGSNYKSYSNKQVDALINAGDAELNPTKRTADYEKADADHGERHRRDPAVLAAEHPGLQVGDQGHGEQQQPHPGRPDLERRAVALVGLR